MRVLYIIGIILSVVGIIASIYIMTESECYCLDDNYYGSHVPGDAIGGSMITMLLFIFFLIMCVLLTARSYSDTPRLAQAIPPFQANPYPNFQQQNQYQNPYQNPYQQHPYQQNPYQNPNTTNPYQNPNTNNPYQKPNDKPQDPPPTNPWEPK